VHHPTKGRLPRAMIWSGHHISDLPPRFPVATHDMSIDLRVAIFLHFNLPSGRTAYIAQSFGLADAGLGRAG
jgi:hypothetical protein